jgi:hypothetical protein
MEMPNAALPAHGFVHGPILPVSLGRPPGSPGLDPAGVIVLGRMAHHGRPRHGLSEGGAMFSTQAK